MKKVWKWVIGIVVVLLVLGAIFTAPYVMHNYYGFQGPYGADAGDFDEGYGPGWMMNSRAPRGFGPGGFHHGGMMGRGYGFQHPMMYGFGFFPFGFFNWLFLLAVIGFAIYGVIALINRRPAPASPARTCTNCGKPAQGDWSTCPHCGTTL